MRRTLILATAMRLLLLGSMLVKCDSSIDWMPYQWDEMENLVDANAPVTTSQKPYASEILKGQPLYVTLTTIHSRIFGIADTVESIIKGTVWPDHIYILVSRDPHLLDLGVTPEFILSESKGQLKELARTYPRISVMFTDNIGPHRKLLPLLAKKWNEDCAIVTIDDHETYRKTTLESLIKYYEASGRNAVVALRARRMGICSDAPPWKVSPYTKKQRGLWPEASPGLREMLILPTGTGGVLYHPKFFHPMVFNRKLMNITKTGDDLLFRLATLTMGVPVVTACAEKDALGKKCPPKIPFLNVSMKNFPDMHQFTFGVLNNAKAIREMFVSPGTYSKQPVSDRENREKHRNGRHSKDRKKRMNNGESEMELSGLNSTNGARTRKRHLDSQKKSKNRRTGDKSKSYGEDGMMSTEVKSAALRNEFTDLSNQKTNLRRLEAVNVAWKDDPRKTESLASRFNTGGGNNMMWDHSLEYLYNTKIIDFHLLLQAFAPLERNYCLLNPSVISPKKRTSMSSFEQMADYLRIKFQSSYNSQCGICLCDS